MRKRGEEKVAEVVADEAAASVEAVLKEPAEQRFIFRKSDHAISNVAGRENTILAAQAAGAAAVIGDGDDRSKVGDGMLARGMFIGAADYMFLEAAEKCRKAGAAAESDNAETAVRSFRLGRGFFHVRMAGIDDTSLYRKDLRSENAEDKRRGQTEVCSTSRPCRLSPGREVR